MSSMDLKASFKEIGHQYPRVLEEQIGWYACLTRRTAPRISDSPISLEKKAVA
jgi:hypothetical protein